MKKISGWGNYPVVEAEEVRCETEAELRRELERPGRVIPRGNGRSYGDSSLSERVLTTLRYNRLLAFDDTTGELHCQAGVLLADILEVFVPRGWFLPVTPGTKLITVGGAIACDVHGKSHHVTGSFCRHLISMEVMLPDGTVKPCSRRENPELFALTCGGMGLTGMILSATFRLIPVETAYMREEVVKAPCLDAVMDLFESSSEWTYSVAWIDCLKTGPQAGRSLLMRGEHARAGELQALRQREHPLTLPARPELEVPFMFPDFALNKFTMQAFNFAYWHKAFKERTERIARYDTFFYPLDAVAHWNRIYGSRGFTQYQFVLPLEAGREGLRAILDRIAEAGTGSFLAVLKLFGEQDDLISFPMKGYTLALDFPLRPGLFAFLDELDRMVEACGGRLYLTKDVRMGSGFFMRSYPNAALFKEAVAALQTGPARFSSLQSRRLGITE